MSGSNTLYQVDAFTDQPFKGNPAGVMITESYLPEELMQNIALEMNLSETAFVVKDGDGFNIRYFTPTDELEMCGHPTLASAHIIYELGLADHHSTLNFQAKGGKLSAWKSEDGIAIDLPGYPLSSVDSHPEFLNHVGFEPIEMLSSSYNWKIAIAESETQIATASPDFNWLLENGLGHLMITAKSNRPDTDFVVRCFAPVFGVNEDPVTGSAHCALTPLWAERLGKTEMRSIQLSKRTGRLKVKLKGDRIEIHGHAVTVFEVNML